MKAFFFQFERQIIGKLVLQYNKTMKLMISVTDVISNQNDSAGCLNEHHHHNRYCYRTMGWIYFRLSTVISCLCPFLSGEEFD